MHVVMNVHWMFLCKMVLCNVRIQTDNGIVKKCVLVGSKMTQDYKMNDKTTA
jgi:hypothetical protein